MRTFFASLILTIAVCFASVENGCSQSFAFRTIAGLAGSSGAIDGTNDNARFNWPSGLELDEMGSVYVADLLAHTIRRITPVGTNWFVSTLAGLAGSNGSADGTNSDARFDHPSAVTVDDSQNLYVTDNYNQTIRRLTQIGTNWIVSTIAGMAGVIGFDDGTNTAALFHGPQAVAVDTSHRLYVTDRLNFTIRELEPLGTNWVTSTIAGIGGFPYGGFVDGLNGDAEFNLPYGIARDASGVLYVADFGNNAVRKIAPIGPDWNTTTVTGFSGNTGTNDGPASVAMFNGPNGIAVDIYGSLYVADQYNNTIRRLTPNGASWTVSTIGGLARSSGSADGTGASARFYWPWGLAVNSTGTLFVADTHNRTIRIGVPIVPIPPALQILCASNQVILSWPATATNFTLQTSALTNGIITSGTNFFLTNGLGTAAGFYRLRQN